MSDMRKSELSKWGLNELCCKRTVYRWNRLELNFPLMYGTGTLQREQKFPVRGALYSTSPVYSTVRTSSSATVCLSSIDFLGLRELPVPGKCDSAHETWCTGRV